MEKGHNGHKPNLSARNNGYQQGEKPFSPLPGFVSYHKSVSELLFMTLHGFIGHIGVAINTLNRSPTLSVGEENPSKTYKRIKPLDSDSYWCLSIQACGSS